MREEYTQAVAHRDAAKDLAQRQFLTAAVAQLERKSAALEESERGVDVMKVPALLRTQFAVIVHAVKKAQEDQANDLAAAIAFWAFFSIFPLLIGILSLASYFLESAESYARINAVANDLLPGSANLVSENLEAVVRYRGPMTWIGLGGLLWTAGKGFGAITRSVNRAQGNERTHSALLSRLRYTLMAVAVSILMIASIGIAMAIEIVLDPSFLARLGLAAVEVPRLEGWTLSFVLVFLIFTLVYRLVPYVGVQWRKVLPGAFLAAVLFELCKAAFVLYLDRFAHLEAIYGSLSSIVVLLLWLYVSALILVFGAEYNIMFWNVRNANSAMPPGAPAVIP